LELEFLFRVIQWELDVLSSVIQLELDVLYRVVQLELEVHLVNRSSEVYVLTTAFCKSKP
jgi:hypothetical protein